MNSSTPLSQKRRLALKTLGGSALIGGLASKLPDNWQRPLINAAVSPIHAETWERPLIDAATLPGHAQVSAPEGVETAENPIYIRVGDRAARRASAPIQVTVIVTRAPNGQATSVRIGGSAPAGSPGAEAASALAQLIPAAHAQTAGLAIAQPLTLYFGGNNSINGNLPIAYNGRICQYPVRASRDPAFEAVAIDPSASPTVAINPQSVTVLGNPAGNGQGYRCPDNLFFGVFTYPDLAAANAGTSVIEQWIAQNPLPATAAPTTLAPTTLAPDTPVPTTLAPTTFAPTPLVPTTAAATTAVAVENPTTTAASQTTTAVVTTADDATSMPPATAAATTMAGINIPLTTAADVTDAPLTTAADVTDAPFTTAANATDAPLTTAADATGAPLTTPSLATLLFQSEDGQPLNSPVITISEGRMRTFRVAIYGERTFASAINFNIELNSTGELPFQSAEISGGTTARPPEPDFEIHKGGTPDEGSAAETKGTTIERDGRVYQTTYKFIGFEIPAGEPYTLITITAEKDVYEERIDQRFDLRIEGTSTNVMRQSDVSLIIAISDTTAPPPGSTSVARFVRFIGSTEELTFNRVAGQEAQTVDVYIDFGGESGQLVVNIDGTTDVLPDTEKDGILTLTKGEGEGFAIIKGEGKIYDSKSDVKLSFEFASDRQMGTYTYTIQSHEESRGVAYQVGTPNSFTVNFVASTTTGG